MPNTPTHDYAENGQLKELEEYLKRYPCHVNATNDVITIFIIIIISLLLLNSLIAWPDSITLCIMEGSFGNSKVIVGPWGCYR